MRCLSILHKEPSHSVILDTTGYVVSSTSFSVLILKDPFLLSPDTQTDRTSKLQSLDLLDSSNQVNGNTLVQNIWIEKKKPVFWAGGMAQHLGELAVLAEESIP